MEKSLINLINYSSSVAINRMQCGKELNYVSMTTFIKKMICEICVKRSCARQLMCKKGLTTTKSCDKEIFQWLHQRCREKIVLKRYQKIDSGNKNSEVKLTCTSCNTTEKLNQRSFFYIWSFFFLQGQGQCLYLC